MNQPEDDHIAVDLATLRHLAGELEGILRELNDKLLTLYDRTEKIVLNWRGEAREAFIDELGRWEREMEDLQARQAWLHAVVTTGHANYSAAHKAVLRGWGAA